jgi:hypothetical protein
VGIVGVVAGTAWAFGGIDSLITIARTLADLLPLLLVVAGASAILLVAVPRGLFAGPATIILIGVLALAAEHGLFGKSLFAHVPAFTLIGVGVIIAMSNHENLQSNTGVERCTAILLPRTRHVTGIASLKIIGRAIFGMLRLDLSRADYPTTASRLWVDVTCVMGRVEIILPKEWKVRAGRLELARHITFEGSLTNSDLAPPTELADKYGEKLVVLNVLGWGGAVLIQRP